ncbi:MAG: sugar phosphate isomerase/epimerase family protein [Candidatus Hodarchaeota archaeon]
MKIGASSMFLWDSEIEELCLQLPKIGLDALDVWFDSPSLYLADEKIVKSKLEALCEASLTKVSHVASHDLNPCSYSKEVRELTYQLTKKSILYAEKMDARFVTIHGGHNSFGKNCSQYDKNLFFEYIETIIDWNPTDVILTIENSLPLSSKLLSSPETISKTLKDFSEVKLTFDYAHVPYADSNVWEEFLCQYHNRLAVVHLSNPSQEHHRIEFDDRLSSFLNWLKSRAPNIILILEYEQDHLIGNPLEVLEEDARQLRNEWKSVKTEKESPFSVN